MFRNQALKYGRKIAAVGTGLSLTVGQAFAAVPADVSTAITDMKADTLTVAAAFLVVSIVVAAYLAMKKGAK